MRVKFFPRTAPTMRFYLVLLGIAISILLLPWLPTWHIGLMLLFLIAGVANLLYTLGLWVTGLAARWKAPKPFSAQTYFVKPLVYGILTTVIWAFALPMAVISGPVAGEGKVDPQTGRTYYDTSTALPCHSKDLGYRVRLGFLPFVRRASAKERARFDELD